MNATKARIVLALILVFLAASTAPASAQNQTWIRQLGTSSFENSEASAPDGVGGQYVGGETSGSLGGPFAGGWYDAWLAHYDSAGTQTWILQIGTSGDDTLNAAATDGSGGVFVTGFTAGSLGGPLNGESDVWIAHYDIGGNQTWIRQFGTSVSEYVNAAASDGSGGVFLSGYTAGSLGGPSSGEYDAWIAHYDIVGNQTWIRQFGTARSESAEAVSSDGSSGALVSGYTTGDLGAPSSGGYDAWLAHYDIGGTQTWIRQSGTTGTDMGRLAAPDGLGGAYVGGNTDGSLGGQATGLTDAWLAHYDNLGNRTWISQIGTSAEDYSRRAAPDGTGGLLVCGGTFGSLAGPSAGGDDTWIARYDGAGSQMWIRQLGTVANDGPADIEPETSGGFYVCGYTRGSLGGPSNGGADAWLARYDGPCLTPLTYCTAKVNSAGCLPTIGWAGSPTASGPIDNFHVTASNVLNRKPGIMLWSTLPGSTPLGGGTLCLTSPIVRTPGQLSGGSPTPTIDCTGQYAFHFGHAYIQNYFLGSGQTIRAQYWSRDPGFATPNNIGLTNALSFVICP